MSPPGSRTGTLGQPTLPQTILWRYGGARYSIVLSARGLRGLGGRWHRQARRADTAAQPAHQVEHVVGQSSHVSIEVHLAQATQAGTGPAEAIEGGEGPFGDGLPAAKSLPVRVRTVSFLGSYIPGIIHRQGEVPTFLLWRKAGFPDGAGLTVFVTRHIPVGAAPLVETALAQDFALGTNQVVAVVDEFPGGNHAGLVPGVDGDAGRDVPFLQQLPLSPARDTGCRGSFSINPETAFDSRSETWVTPLDKMNPPRSAMTFSWYRSPEALPALGVGQWAPVETGFSGILPSGLWKYLAVSSSTPSPSTAVPVIMNRP